jgi:hypothetical protein
MSAAAGPWGNPGGEYETWEDNVNFIHRRQPLQSRSLICCGRRGTRIHRSVNDDRSCDGTPVHRQPAIRRGMDNLFSTHPSTENRVAALNEREMLRLIGRAPR